MCSVLLVDGCVSVAFLHFGLVAFRNLFGTPPGYVLGCGVERQDFVEKSVVEQAVDFLLDVCEVAYHTVFVECARLAVYGDVPVVSVQVGTFAFVVQVEAVAGRHLHFLYDIVHGFVPCAVELLNGLDKRVFLCSSGPPCTKNSHQGGSAASVSLHLLYVGAVFMCPSRRNLSFCCKFTDLYPVVQVLCVFSV